MTHSTQNTNNQHTNTSGMQHNAATTEPTTEPTHHRSHRSARARSGNNSPTAQNSEVDRLNDQSLQAAQQGRSFEPGSGNMGSGNMGSGNMGSGNMGSGNMGPGGMSGSGSMGSGSSTGGGKM
jgi:hypothetical protein